MFRFLTNKYKQMKIYKYYLKGTQVNTQLGCKPKWFVLKFFNYRAVIRVWRIQLVLEY